MSNLELIEMSTVVGGSTAVAESPNMTIAAHPYLSYYELEQWLPNQAPEVQPRCVLLGLPVTDSLNF